MEKTEFLEKHIFTDLQNLNTNVEADDIYSFSELDFGTILERIEHFGIGIYTIEGFLNGKSYDVKTNEDSRKKATDPKWYKGAYSGLKKRQADLQYTATFKISDKLLAKENIQGPSALPKAASETSVDEDSKES
ncbi:hypothetical protein [uncultured Dokdonia sp.]|uniref:hypothetical protein n=1 Tax=uncultured Dokdonia sp. TaxID=575653 RepID=UPI0026185ACE|nr:hypothetical protein [uncultured Dokdonia sp.]